MRGVLIQLLNELWFVPLFGPLFGLLLVPRFVEPDQPWHTLCRRQRRGRPIPLFFNYLNLIAISIGPSVVKQRFLGTN